MNTGNLRRESKPTSYVVKWAINGEEKFNQVVDTNIQSMPDLQMVKTDDDYPNDYLHARRILAAARETAGKLLTKELSNKKDKLVPITIMLITNHKKPCQVKRGIVQIIPIGDSTVEVQLIIGNGSNRNPASVPPTPHKFDPINVKVDESSSNIIRALQVIEVAAPQLVDKLTEKLESNSG